GGRSAKSTGTARMADAPDPARASIHSLPGCHRPSVRREELIAVCRSFAEMVSISPAAPSAFYRSRPAPRALPEPNYSIRRLLFRSARVVETRQNRTRQELSQRDFVHGFRAEDFADIESFYRGGATLVFATHDLFDDRLNLVA